VGQMFADDVAAGGAEDVADKEDIHLRNASTFGEVFRIVGCGEGCEQAGLW
jgi:hypothetical protein